MATFWATFVENLATFNSSIWSHCMHLSPRPIFCHSSPFGRFQIDKTFERQKLVFQKCLFEMMTKRQFKSGPVATNEFQHN